MKIAIHHREGSFSDRWIKYCKKNNINYKIVNCYDNNIIDCLKDCNVLIWHHHHGLLKDFLLAKPLLFTLQQSGMVVFPDFNTNWHFDDKIGQKYLFEINNIPSVPTFIFYNKRNALNWIDKTAFPKVFKLRGGAGALNVKLINTKNDARKIINTAFGKGFKKIDKNLLLAERFKKYRLKQINTLTFCKYFIKDYLLTSKNYERESGYVYFQNFIPNNLSDIRIIVVGDKAFAIERMVRENDFRASGSGLIKYLNNDSIDMDVLKIAFDSASKINSQCAAFDFVYHNEMPLVVEVSYGFSTLAYDLCPGYWTSNLEWVSIQFIPQDWMIENLLNTL